MGRAIAARLPKIAVGALNTARHKCSTVLRCLLWAERCVAGTAAVAPHKSGAPALLMRGLVTCRCMGTGKKRDKIGFRLTGSPDDAG